MDFSKQTIEVINHMANKLGMSIDWTQKNIIPQLQDIFYRYIKFQTLSQWLKLGIMLIILAISIWLMVRSIKEIRASKDFDDLTIQIITIMVCGAIVLSMSFGICSTINNIIALNIIPEKFILDMIQQN